MGSGLYMVAIHGASPSGRLMADVGRGAELDSGLLLPGESLCVAEVARGFETIRALTALRPVGLDTDLVSGFALLEEPGGEYSNEFCRCALTGLDVDVRVLSYPSTIA